WDYAHRVPADTEYPQLQILVAVKKASDLLFEPGILSGSPSEAALAKISRWTSVGRLFQRMITAAPRTMQNAVFLPDRSGAHGPVSIEAAALVLPSGQGAKERVVVRSV